jgi:DNA-binding Xre family transcriptional regulator
LAEAMDERGMTQSEVARKAGLSFQAVHHLHSGKAKAITFDTLDRLAKALGVTPGQLFEFKRR